MKKLLYLFTLIFISFFISSCTKEKEKPFKPLYEIVQGAEIPEFDPGYAYDQIAKQVSFGPRNPNSNGHKEALIYLQGELNKYTDNITLQPFSYQGYDNEKLELTNIIAKFNPEERRIRHRCPIITHHR